MPGSREAECGVRRVRWPEEIRNRWIGQAHALAVVVVHEQAEGWEGNEECWAAVRTSSRQREWWLVNKVAHQGTT